MANLPSGASTLPGVTTSIETSTSGVSVPGGVRLALLMGTGARTEVVVAAAVGSGNDGLNSTYTSTAGRDSRHFILKNAPLISNRTQLFKNGVSLTGLEEVPGVDTFDNRYDYRIDIATGKIELQTAYLIDQGGTLYTTGAANVGDGYLTLNGISGVPILIDLNAPTETWTVKCVSVQRDGLGAPIAQTAKFLAFGSISGIQLDSTGTPIMWVANSTQVNNSILKFAISETTPVFREGDYFTLQVKGGALNKNDSITATYIATADINDPEFFTSMDELVSKHGSSTLDNTLSLGASLAFANSPPGIFAMETKPALPRRTSIILDSNFDAISSDVNTFVIPLPIGVTPNFDSSIHIFVTDPTTLVETQLLPNKVTFDSLVSGTDPLAAPTSTFVFSDIAAPGGTSFCYTVTSILNGQVLNFGADGYLTALNYSLLSDGYLDGSFTVPGVTFTAAYIGKQVQIFDAVNSVDNNGTFDIIGVVNGALIIDGSNITESAQVNFVSEGTLDYEVIDQNSGDLQSYLVLNHNIVPDGNSLRVTLVDNRDADFFDAGWVTALQKLETIEIDILVPLPQQTMSVIFQNCLNHCLTMSNLRNKKERVLFTGAIQGLTPENLTGAEPAAVEDIGILEGIQGDTVAEVLSGNTEDLTNYSVADGFGHAFRAMYFYPDEIVTVVGGEDTKVSGFYIGAAAAGLVSGTANIAMPLTNKVISGFNILRDKTLSVTTLEQLAAAGVAVLQPVAGGGRVVWGLTTTQSGFPEEQEMSIIFIRDRIAKTLRAGFAGFVGMPEEPDTMVILATRAVGLLQSFINQRIITDFAGLLVRRDSVDPRQWNISVKVQPNYPVNWIFLRVGIGVI